MKPDEMVETFGVYDIYAKEFHPYWWSEKTATCYYAINHITGHRTLLYGYIDVLKDLLNRLAIEDSPENRVYKAIKGTSLDAEIVAELGIGFDEVRKAAEKLAEKGMVRIRTIKKDDVPHLILTKVKK